MHMTEKTENDPSAESDKPVVQEQAEQVPSISQNPAARLISAPAPPFDDKYQDKAFLLDDTFYRTRVQKSLHWSIIWSDLMMSMFILFLAMYAYQMAHQEFLAKKTPEVVGGSTTDAMDINAPVNNASLPFQPINKGLPLTAGTIKKVESVTGDAMTPAEEKKFPGLMSWINLWINLSSLISPHALTKSVLLLQLLRRQSQRRIPLSHLIQSMT